MRAAASLQTSFDFEVDIWKTSGASVRTAQVRVMGNPNGLRKSMALDEVLPIAVNEEEKS